MGGSETTLLVLLVILFLGAFIPSLIRPLRLPFVAILILIGAVFGPNGVSLIQSNEVIEFFGFLGFAFLMFMAGLETDITSVQKNVKRVSIMALLNGLLPFTGGVIIALSFGYHWQTALLLGAIFISSSVAMVIPAVKESKHINKLSKELMISSVVIEDGISLLMVAIIFQVTAPITSLPLGLYFFILVASIIALLYGLPWLAKRMRVGERLRVADKTESEIRFTLVVLLAVLVYFSALGVHPILAAFLVGMFISQSIPQEHHLYEKFHVISYGLFVPVFFFVAGMQMNLKALVTIPTGGVVVVTVVTVLIVTKVVSGYMGARFAKLTPDNAWHFGVFSTAQLTTTIAAAFTAFSLGLLDELLFTAVASLSVITTIIVPLLFSTLFAEKK